MLCYIYTNLSGMTDPPKNSHFPAPAPWTRTLHRSCRSVLYNLLSPGPFGPPICSFLLLTRRILLFYIPSSIFGLLGKFYSLDPKLEYSQGRIEVAQLSFCFFFSFPLTSPPPLDSIALIYPSAPFLYGVLHTHFLCIFQIY